MASPQRQRGPYQASAWSGGRGRAAARSRTAGAGIPAPAFQLQRSGSKVDEVMSLRRAGAGTPTF